MRTITLLVVPDNVRYIFKRLWGSPRGNAMAVADIAAITVKEEEAACAAAQPDPVDLEERILELCASHSKGVTEEVITDDQPNMTKDKIVKALQRLLSMGKIEIFKQGSKLIYRVKVASSLTNKTKGFEKEEKLVYQVIEDSSNKGIWIRDIRFKSNLPHKQISKILKTLESKKLIKSVKSVSAARKKVYMLYDIVPDESLTGGAWYSNDQEFETEFVDILNHKCYQYLQHKSHKARSQSSNPNVQRRMSYVTINEVCKFITDSGISKVQLSEDNIGAILRTLVYDGKAEETIEVAMGTSSSQGNIKKYRLSQGMGFSPGLSCVPCGVCPVIDQCSDDGVISPPKCVYMNKWLKF